ncbi:hypothetical protein PSPO01_02112 [Paraphaeosphaeria sporulosa]
MVRRATLRTSPQASWRVCAPMQSSDSDQPEAPLAALPTKLSPLPIPRTCPYLTCPINSFEKNLKPSIRATKSPACPDTATILLARRPPSAQHQRMWAAAPAPRDPSVWCLDGRGCRATVPRKRPLASHLTCTGILAVARHLTPKELGKDTARLRALSRRGNSRRDSGASLVTACDGS